MVGAIALKKTDRIGGITCEAANDLGAEASAPYLTDGEYGLLTAFATLAFAPLSQDAVRTIEYMGALETLRLADGQAFFKPGKEPVHE
jgi:hypothetical protein